MGNEKGYIYFSHGRFLKKNLDSFIETYNRLILEWTKELNTPNQLLINIKTDSIYYTNSLSWIVEYDYNKLKNIITKKYHWYNSWNNILKPYTKIRIFYYYDNFEPLLQYYTKQTVLDFEEKLKNLKANCLYDENLSRGCLIYLNGHMIDITDDKDLEFNLDHQLNHYFTAIKNKFNINKINDIKNINQKFKIIAQRAGYQTNTDDFKTHMFNKKQFQSMCCDVCNILEQEHQNYYIWLNQTTAKYLISKQFKQLSINKQNILLFSYACRLLSKQRWKLLKEYVFKQLNQPKKNIFKDGLNFIRDLFIKMF